MKERGQSLVETALILPFLLVLLVGLVELGVALERQIVVVNAAREGARFGATGAATADIYAQTQLSVSRMFDFDEGNAVVAVIHAEVDETGDGFEDWQEKVYPEGAAAPHMEPWMVLAELRAAGDPAGVRLVIVDVEYDHEAVLGLPFVSALAGRIPVGSWTAMRLESLAGLRKPPCCVYPIALDAGAVGDNMEDIRLGSGPGMFGWLYWDSYKSGDAGYLEANIKDPCRVADEFRNACDPEDAALDVGDWIAGDAGESVSEGVKREVGELKGQYVRLPLWDRFAACSEIGCDCRPGSQAAHLAGFVVVEVTDVQLTGSPKTISARFVRVDEGCQ